MASMDNLPQLAGAAAVGNPAAVRLEALQLLGALASVKGGLNENNVRLWNDAAVRDAVVAAGAADQSDELREKALFALFYLALKPANRHSIWQHFYAQAAIFHAAAGDHAVCRKHALGALRHLALGVRNRETMWERVEFQAVSEPRSEGSEGREGRERSKRSERVRGGGERAAEAECDH